MAWAITEDIFGLLPAGLGSSKIFQELGHFRG